MEKQNFIATITNSTSYDGERLASYILKAFTASKFVESLPAQNVISDIVLKTKIGKLDGDNLIQCGDACSFQDGGDLVASESVLYPQPLFINKEICYADLEPIYNSLNTGAMSKEELSSAFATALTDLLVSKMAEATQEMYINGSTGSTGCTNQISGLDEQIVTNVVTGATLTKSNIIAALSSLVNGLPENVLEKDDVTIYMNRKTLQLYWDALAALASLTPLDTMQPQYMGIPIVTVPVIKKDKMYIFQKSNIFVGVGSTAEFAQLAIINMRPLGQGNAVRLILQGKGDVKIGWEEEAAKYKV